MTDVLRVIISLMIVPLSLIYADARGFDELHVSGPCELQLVESPDSCGLISSGGDVTGLDFRYAGNAVYVTVSNSSSATGRRCVKLYYDGHLQLVKASGRAIVRTEKLESSAQLSVVASGASSIAIGRLSAASVNLSLSGSGKIIVGDALLASTVNFSLIGSGSVSAEGITASRMTVTQRGSGKMDFGGSAHDCDVVVRGTGTVDVRRLVAGEMDLKLFGTGHIFYPAGVRVSLAGDTDNIKQVKPYQPL